MSKSKARQSQQRSDRAAGASSSDSPTKRDGADYAQRHIKIGWWTLAVFLSLGIVLEALHALKIGWYLNVSNESRRFMWTLAHTHGTLIGLIHIAFGASAASLRADCGKRIGLASGCLTGATCLLPGGFILGGLFIYDGDPGVGVWLVPLGAFLLLVSVVQIARSISRR